MSDHMPHKKPVKRNFGTYCLIRRKSIVNNSGNPQPIRTKFYRARELRRDAFPETLNALDLAPPKNELSVSNITHPFWHIPAADMR